MTVQILKIEQLEIVRLLFLKKIMKRIMGFPAWGCSPMIVLLSHSYGFLDAQGHLFCGRCGSNPSVSASVNE